jgi:hypothetical protein
MERLFSSPLNSRDAPRRKNGAAKIRSVTLQEQQGENEHAFEFHTFREGRLSVTRHMEDWMGLFRQIGALPSAL